MNDGWDVVYGMVLILGLCVIVWMGAYDTGMIKGQKMALTGGEIIHQVTNEYGEVKWVKK